MPLNVRRMTESDIDSVYAIESTAHITPWSRQILKDCVLVGYDCRVLEFDEESSSTIIGYLIARHSTSQSHLLNLCIAKDAQSKGYGRTLLTTYLSSIEHNAILKSVVLEVRPSNAAALHLYATLGFHRIEIKKAYYSDVNGSEDAIVLEKKLCCG